MAAAQSIRRFMLLPSEPRHACITEAVDFEHMQNNGNGLDIAV